MGSFTDEKRRRDLREAGYHPDGSTPIIDTLADVVRLAREFKDEGIPAAVLNKNGLQAGPVAAGLRQRGYRVEIRDEALHLTGNPGSTARENKSRWQRLFEPPERPSMLDPQ